MFAPPDWLAAVRNAYSSPERPFCILYGVVWFRSVINFIPDEINHYRTHTL